MDVIIRAHRRDGWTTPLEEVEICPEAADYEAAGLHTLAKQAQAAASNLADRFHSVNKESWTSYFTREVELSAYAGSAPPAEIIELAKTVSKQGATRVYFRIAKNGEGLVLAIVPMSEGTQCIRVAQWAPEGLCTKLNEIKRAERITASFIWSLLVIAFVFLGFMVYDMFNPSRDGMSLWLFATYVPLAACMFSGRIRHKLISQSKHARAVMP